MKIFFIDPNNSTAQVNYPLIEELSKKGVDITYYSSLNRWDADYYQNSYKINSDYIFFKLANKISNQKIRKKIKGITYPLNLFILLIMIFIKRPQIIHLNNITIPIFDLIFLSILKLGNYKIILTQHNYLGHDRKTISKFKLKTFEKVNKIICLSDFTKNQFPEYLKDKIIKINHGNVYEKEIEQSLANNNVKECDSFSVLFFGLIRPYKGIELLIKAVKFIPESIKKNLIVTVAGKVHDKNYLIKLNNLRSDNTSIQIIDRFLEYNEIISLIRKASIGVLPYTSATQSGVPYLYTALNTPLIVTNVGALPEQISTEFAEIAEPDPKDLGNAIIKLYNRIVQKEITESSFEKFNAANCWRNISEEYYRAYKNLLTQ